MRALRGYVRRERRGLFHFCRIFAAVFFLSPYSLPLPPSSQVSRRGSSRRDLIPTKTPSNSPFRPENLIILTFPSPKICTYQKKCVPLHRKVRIGVPEDFQSLGRAEASVLPLRLPQILICGKRRKHDNYICYIVT